MTLPLVVLAALSLGGGFLDVPRWLEPMFPRGRATTTTSLVVISVAAGLAGIALAWLFYVAGRGWRTRSAQRLGWLYGWSTNKYFVDEIYDAAVVQPLVDGSASVLWKGIDVGLIDGQRERHRPQARGHRRRAAAAAVGQHPQLRRLGAARLGAADAGAGLLREGRE